MMTERPGIRLGYQSGSDGFGGLVVEGPPGVWDLREKGVKAKGLTANASRSDWQGITSGSSSRASHGMRMAPGWLALVPVTRKPTDGSAHSRYP